MTLVQINGNMKLLINNKKQQKTITTQTKDGGASMKNAYDAIVIGGGTTGTEIGRAHV